MDQRLVKYYDLMCKAQKLKLQKKNINGKEYINRNNLLKKVRKR